MRAKPGIPVRTYSQVLRVIGQFVDRNDLSEVRVLETGEGWILQGLVLKGARAGQRDTYQLTNDDIESMILDAQAERGRRI